MFEKLLAFSRVHKIALLVCLDVLLLPFALFSAVILRLGGVWDAKLDAYVWIFALAPLWAVPIFVHLGLYRAVLKFVDDKIVFTVLYGVSLSVLVLSLVIVMAKINAFPRSSILIFWVFACAYIGGSRFLIRGLARKIDALDAPKKPVLIYGAGEAGIQLALALHAGREYRPMAFIDDNARLWKKTFRGMRVYSPKYIDGLLEDMEIHAILLAMPSIGLARQREILEALEPLHVLIKRLPSLADLVSNNVKIDELKEVDIEDLLGRDPVPPHENLLAANIQNQIVMVTGAGGSIGSELCRQIVKQKPKRLVLFEVSEFALYQIHQELILAHTGVEIMAILGSVLDLEHLKNVMSRCQVETIYHAAAYKHVPMVEHNPILGVRNNSFGTRYCALAAQASGVKTFVLISTDKAVRPTNIMGATKRLAELILQDLNTQGSKTRFVMVRFGNVLGSSGSVVPLFKQQLKQGGPLTITDEKITRFFMTIPEAAQLVIQAGAMGEGGDVFVLDMGEPVKIIDLARRMIHLSGLTVKEVGGKQGDIAIEITGLRPGEKLYEELLIDDTVLKTEHSRILRANEYQLEHEQLQSLLASIDKACVEQDADQTFALMKQVVPEFNPAQGTVDYLTRLS